MSKTCATSKSRGRSRTVKRVQIKQLTSKERRSIDKMIRSDKKTPTDALRSINKSRVKSGIREVEKSTVHRYAKGLTHIPETEETRGRPPALTKKQIQLLDQARRRLIKRANNARRVTYADIIKEANLGDVASQRSCEEVLVWLEISAYCGG